MRTLPRFPEQHGLASRNQLSAAEWTPDARRHLVATVGQRPFPGVYAGHRGTLTDAEELSAAVLWAGPRALLTGAHALKILGVELPHPPSVYRFLTQDGLYAHECPGAAVVRTTRWPAERPVGGLRVAALERSLLDASRYQEYPAAQIQALTISVLQGGLSTVARVRAEVRGGRRNGTAAVSRGLRDFEGGSWSMAEVLLRRLLARRPWTVLYNPRLEDAHGLPIGTPDAYLPEHGIAVQIHSKRYHCGPDSDGADLWESTVEGDSRFGAQGIIALGFAPNTIRKQGIRVLATIEAAVAARAGASLPPVRIALSRASTSSAIDPSLPPVRIAQTGSLVQDASSSRSGPRA